MWRIIGPLTARARSPQRKGRCVRVEPLVFRRARAAAFARSGVQSAEWRAQGHKTTSRVPQERSFARRKTNNSQSKQVLIAVWRRGLGIDSGSPRTRSRRSQSSDHCAARFPSLRRQTTKPQHPDLFCPGSESTVAALNARASTVSIAAAPDDERSTQSPLLPRQRAHCYTAPRRPWARKKRKQTMNHLHST